MRGPWIAALAVGMGLAAGIGAALAASPPGVFAAPILTAQGPVLMLTATPGSPLRTGQPAQLTVSLVRGTLPSTARIQIRSATRLIAQPTRLPFTVAVQHDHPHTATYQAVALVGSTPIGYSNPLTLRWDVYAHGTALPHANSFGQTVALDWGVTVQQGTSVIHAVAIPHGFRNPVYQFWYLAPGGGWTQGQGYSPDPVFTLPASIRGTWSLVVIAREADAPSGEATYAERAIWEAKSATAAIPITTGAAPTTPTRRTAPGLVTVTVPATVTLGQPITVTATAAGITDPTYEFWYETPAGQWRSTHGYTAPNQYTFDSTMPGIYRVVVYARPSGIAINQGAGVRLATEAQSTVQTVHVMWPPQGG